MTSEEPAPEFRPFFEHAAAGELRFPCCRACERFHWYPMPLCPHCRSDRIVWRRVSGNGTLFSWTVVRHAFEPSYRDRVPYIVGLVTFAEAPGIRLITNIVELGSRALSIDMPVEPVFGGTLAASGSAPVCFRPSIRPTAAAGTA